MPSLLFIGLCVVWGASFILMKTGGACFGPLAIGAYRVILGGLVLLPLLAWNRRAHFGLRTTDIGALLALVLIGYIAPFWLQPMLISKLDNSGIIGMMVAFVPLYTVIASMPMLGRYPSRRELIGVGGGLVCLALIYRDGLSQEIGISDLVLASLTPLCYAFANTYVKRRFATVSPLALATIALLAAGLLLLPLTMAFEHVERGPQFSRALGALMVLGIICTGAATAVFYRLIRDHGPLYAGMVAYVIPVVALVIGWADGEPWSALQIAALIGVLAMVAIVQYRPRQPRPQPEPECE